jgi:hypothetical protein
MPGAQMQLVEPGQGLFIAINMDGEHIHSFDLHHDASCELSVFYANKPIDMWQKLRCPPSVSELVIGHTKLHRHQQSLPDKPASGKVSSHSTLPSPRYTAHHHHHHQ